MSTATDDLLSARIAEALRASEEPLGPKQIHESIGGSYDSIRSTLGTMRDRGEVERVGHGRYRPPQPQINGTSEPTEIYSSAEDVPPGRYAHLVQAGTTWDYELTDPDSGTVRAAVQIRFMVAPDVRRRSLQGSLSSSPAADASAGS